MRGEDGLVTVVIGVVAGSPPHAWGRRYLINIARAACRFTPTCVGKTRILVVTHRECAVHPHMRGEDSIPLRLQRPHTGSPPHAWGRRLVPEIYGIRYWFTPTCVGKTRILVVTHRECAVHPHMRGEDVTRQSTHGKHVGSPPHAWGRRQHPVGYPLRHRFTPTCVGKTSSGLYPSTSKSGSPPHAWGRLELILLAPPLVRFTPTCVGKTGRASIFKDVVAVHPHMRGEDPRSSKPSPNYLKGG